MPHRPPSRVISPHRRSHYRTATATRQAIQLRYVGFSHPHFTSGASTDACPAWRVECPCKCSRASRWRRRLHGGVHLYRNLQGCTDRRAIGSCRRRLRDVGLRACFGARGRRDRRARVRNHRRHHCGVARGQLRSRVPGGWSRRCDRIWIPGKNLGQVIEKTLLSMVAAGTTSELTGGKFANGAISAAFSAVVQGFAGLAVERGRGAGDTIQPSQGVQYAQAPGATAVSASSPDAAQSGGGFWRTLGDLTPEEYAAQAA